MYCMSHKLWLIIYARIVRSEYRKSLFSCEPVPILVSFNETLANLENEKWTNRQPEATLDICSEKCFNWENDFIKTIEKIFNEDITGKLGDELICAESYNIGPHTTLGMFP